MRSHLVWRMFNKAPHTKILDHKNRDKLDDRIENLREITPKDNIRNSDYMDCKRSDCTMGVYKNNNYKKPWGVQFQVGKTQKYFGRFDTQEQAIARALEVRQELGKL